MKKGFLVFLAILYSLYANSQYNQKVSFNFNAGTFKTFGKQLGISEPMQMPNYKMGFAANLGLQFKVFKRFSFSAEVGLKVSERWSYGVGNDNYYHWYIKNPVTEIVIDQGESYLDLYNYSLGVRPIYYLNQGEKLSFFIFAGINVNSTTALYLDTKWLSLYQLNMLPADDPGPVNNNLEKNVGFGFNPGLGLEYFFNERVGLNLTTGYYLILLNKYNFKSPDREENFNAAVIQAGLRLNFIKI